MSNLNNAKIPDVDDGVLYPEITKYIKDGKFVFDYNKQMTVDDFEKYLSGEKFEKVADCVLNLQENFPFSRRAFISGKDYTGKLVDYIPISKKEDLWKKEEKEWVYLLCYNKKIVKIGMTSSGLSSRYGSYNCGTKKAMKKGSCATTNFVITESNYFAKLNGIDVEVFAYEIPEKFVEENIFGRKKMVLNKRAHKYETTLIEIYQEHTGKLPPLCVAYGPTE